MTEDEAYKVHIQYTFNAFCILFPIASNISLYPLAGFTYTNWHLDLGKAGDYDVSGSDGKFGVNLGA